MTMIGIDPHKGTHTAVAVDRDEQVIDEFTLEASGCQVRQFTDWAEGFTKREWAVESGNGLGYLIARQLLAAARPSMTSHRCSQLESGYSVQGNRRRPTRTMHGRSRSQRCGRTVWQPSGPMIM
jgi:hypothetical protein